MKKITKLNRKGQLSSNDERNLYIAELREGAHLTDDEISDRLSGVQKETDAILFSVTSSVKELQLPRYMVVTVPRASSSEATLIDLNTIVLNQLIETEGVAIRAYQSLRFSNSAEFIAGLNLDKFDVLKLIAPLGSLFKNLQSAVVDFVPTAGVFNLDESVTAITVSTVSVSVPSINVKEDLMSFSGLSAISPLIEKFSTKQNDADHRNTRVLNEKDGTTSTDKPSMSNLFRY